MAYFGRLLKKKTCEEDSLIFLLVFSLFLFKNWQAQNYNYFFDSKNVDSSVFAAS